MIIIKNDKGETLDLASSLATYLANRTKRIFYAGDWLNTLKDEELESIQRLSDTANAGDTDALANLTQLTTMIIAAETQQQTIEIEPELIELAPLLAHFVTLERQGFVKINSELSYSKFPETFKSIIMTDKGLTMAELMTEKQKQTYCH